MDQKKRLLYLGNKLAEHGKSPTTADWLPPSLEKEGYEVIAASSKRNKIVRLLDMVQVTYKNRRKIDVVIIDTYSTWNFYYALIIAAICRYYKLPYIPILHGGNLPNRLEKNKRLSQKLFNGAKICVAPSGYILNRFKDHGYTNLTYIPNSIAIQSYPFLARPQIVPKLLWVRSFAEIYNPLLALEILEKLINQGLDATLCMIGPDKDGLMARCKKIAGELRLPVTFTGILPKEEWISLSQEYDIFINTTNFDNMPVSLMEAMALGMPVVSTNVGGLPFMIIDGENGILVPPNNAEAFVTAINDLLGNQEKALSISRNARAEMEKLDWQEVKKLWIELLG